MYPHFDAAGSRMGVNIGRCIPHIYHCSFVLKGDLPSLNITNFMITLRHISYVRRNQTTSIETYKDKVNVNVTLWIYVHNCWCVLIKKTHILLYKVSEPEFEI
jgi:hypothetical protein